MIRRINGETEGTRSLTFNPLSHLLSGLISSHVTKTSVGHLLTSLRPPCTSTHRVSFTSDGPPLLVSKVFGRRRELDWNRSPDVLITLVSYDSTHSLRGGSSSVTVVSKVGATTSTTTSCQSRSDLEVSSLLGEPKIVSPPLSTSYDRHSVLTVWDTRFTNVGWRSFQPLRTSGTSPHPPSADVSPVSGTVCYSVWGEGGSGFRYLSTQCVGGIHYQNRKGNFNWSQTPCHVHQFVSRYFLSNLSFFMYPHTSAPRCYLFSYYHGNGSFESFIY